MSSYKGHTVFAVMLSFLMFYNPLAISLAILGANFPDFDHEFKQNQVLTILALGIITVCFLYFLNLPIYLGLILILLSLIFLFSFQEGHQLIVRFPIHKFGNIFYRPINILLGY